MRPGKKEHIEQAAIRLFALKSFTGTTIKDIATESGVTEGALYRHYPSKDAIATALFMRELADMREKLLDIIEMDMPLAPKLHGIVEKLYDLYAANPYSVLFVLLNFQHTQAINLPGETGNIYDFITERTKQIVSGLPMACSPIAPTLLAGIIIEPILFHHYGRLPDPPSVYVDAVTSACCRLLGIDYALQH